MDTQEISPVVSPAATYCSELEYIVGLQSEELWDSQPRRSQRLREKEQAIKAFAEVNKMAIARAAESGSPQLFDEIDAEYSQLAQLPAKPASNPNDCLKPVRRASRSGKKHRRNSKIVHSDPMPKVRKKRKIKTVGSEKIVYSEPLPENMPLQSLQALNPQHSVKLEPSAPLKASDLAPTNIIVPAPPPQSKPSFMEPNNITQTYSYQCMNATQTILPERYPAHFIHQLPTEPEYITGTIIPSELRRESCGAATQESIPDITTLPGCNGQFSHLSLDAESLVSTTPSLSESLAEVFGTTKIRTLLNIELPRVYRVQEFHLPILASLLEVDLRRLRILLELTQRLTLEQLQQLTQDCCEVFSVQSSSEE